MKFLLRPLVLLVISAAIFAVTLRSTIDQRHRMRQLIRDMDSLQHAARILEDEKRSLFLEYMTVTDYDNLRAAADGLGMREPEFADGSLVFIVPEDR